MQQFWLHNISGNCTQSLYVSSCAGIEPVNETLIRLPDRKRSCSLMFTFKRVTFWTLSSHGMTLLLCIFTVKHTSWETKILHWKRPQKDTGISILLIKLAVTYQSANSRSVSPGRKFYILRMYQFIAKTNGTKNKYKRDSSINGFYAPEIRRMVEGHQV